MEFQDEYHQLTFYTLAHRSPGFIHQHIVDCYIAQTANENTKPIAIFFSLAGLYLYLENNYSGRQVQQAHLLMAERTKEFLKINLPLNRGDITVAAVLAAPPGDQRDGMIRSWSRSVWNAYSKQHDEIISFTEKLLTK